MSDTPDLAAAASAADLAGSMIEAATRRLSPATLDTEQVVAYDLAHAAAAVATSQAAIAYGAAGPVEAAQACAFTADAVWDVATRVLGRADSWGVDPSWLDPAMPFLAAHRDPAWLEGLAGVTAPRHIEPELELVAETFRRFATEHIAPVAESIHRLNGDIPEPFISGLAELGAFGLSIPAQYGGYATGTEHDYLAMVIATEELSRASLCAGGSLITRPEIVARALLEGGTEAQKQRWLPQLADGSVMAAIAVTEPDHGSDVAGITLAAVPTGDGGWALSGTKTWSTFAARADALLVLARTDADRSLRHRGLSLFLVEKDRGDGRGFQLSQPGGGRLDGRPIDTIGYRGMHSYELSFDRWLVPGDHLIGEEAGQGQGFYFQMDGFETGRLQTAARAVGLMQAAYEAALDYASGRVVFGHRIGDYQLTKVKLARMAALINASRQYMYQVARLMGDGQRTLEASMIKAYVCRAAEWVTREAMQIHGGMGYAEEYPVSRYFVDARVLSIFEGADETLALRVVARRLLGAA